MQKLERRNIYTPMDAPQVHSNCDLSLNREETLSVASLKTLSNNSEVDKLRKERRNMSVSVYVLNMRGQPLMPTTPRKARILLKEGKAKVVKRTPFIVQLKYATGETKQPITLGIDSGYSKIGFSAVSDKKEVISGEVNLRNDVSKKLAEKRMYRRGRRNKLWYRKARFSNRKRKDGWFAPSIEHKLQSHIRLIEKIKGVLPISETVIEVSTFDTQKMQNPEISGVEYQQGELQGYEVREYLLEKWGRKCVYCGKSNIPLEVEHIIPRTRGGSDRVSNLTLACNKCNLKKGNKTAEEFGYPKIQRYAKKSLKTAPFMNIVRGELVNHLKCRWTYGYVTKHNRIKLGLEKSHSNDAFVIAGGGCQERAKSYTVKQVRRNNRSIQTNRKGYEPSIRRKRHKLQPNDLVKYNDNIERVKGSHCYGKRVVLEKSGSKSVKDVELITYGKGLVFD